MQRFGPVLAILYVCCCAVAPAQEATPVPGPASAPPAAPQSAPQTMTVSGAAANFNDLIASLNNMRGEIAKIQALNGSSANNLRPVNVSQLAGSNPAALSSAVTRNQGQLSALRGALSRVTVTTMNNEHISVAQFLADNRISLTQVVGASVNNGMLMLYYQKP
jgi:hypothetical protein